MAWKKSENGGFAVCENGNPVWVDDNTSEEKSVDYSAMVTSMANANAESATRRKALKELENKYAVFNGVEDLAAWKSDAEKALEFAANADKNAKDVEATMQERVKAAQEPLQKQLAEVTARAEAIEQKYASENIANSFSRSAYVQDKLVSPQLASDLFASHFKMIDGKLVAHKADGSVIYGQNGEASFDEALPQLIEASPHKGLLLKGSSSSGGGAIPNAGNGGGGATPKSYNDCKTREEKAQYLENKRKNQ